MRDRIIIHHLHLFLTKIISAHCVYENLDRPIGLEHHKVKWGNNRISRISLREGIQKVSFLRNKSTCVPSVRRIFCSNIRRSRDRAMSSDEVESARQVLFTRITLLCREKQFAGILIFFGEWGIFVVSRLCVWNTCSYN